jgi:hypothetical protein
MAISGQVYCLPYAKVEGVWIAVKGGSKASGYATLTQKEINSAHYSYEVPDGKQWTVHVGCGGTKNHWKYTPISQRWQPSNAGTLHWDCYYKVTLGDTTGDIGCFKE